jgi:hypothetical protein
MGCLLAACGSTASAGQLEEPLEVNIQVTGRENIHPMMDELDERDVIATVWLDGTEMDAECEAIEEWSDAGHEIAGMYPIAIDETTTRQAQEDNLSAIADAKQRCGVESIVGFRASRFTANDDTYDLLDNEGYGYLERGARDERYSVYTFKPYAFEDHSFAILPMPVVVYYGQVTSMCDNACRNMMTPDDLLKYEKRAIDMHLRTGEPLIFEWHPSTTYPGDDDGWWGAFTGLLDHLESLGGRVKFVTARDLVERYAGSSE